MLDAGSAGLAEATDAAGMLDARYLMLVMPVLL
jgi:hypothetical protein